MNQLVESNTDLKLGQAGIPMNNESALQEVTQAMKQEKKRRMYERYQAVYLHLKGISITRIAETLNRSRETVSTYIRTYQGGGLEVLHMKHSPGAPARFTKEQQEQLKQVIVSSTPHEVGFTARHNWTLEIIATYIEREFGHRYSLRGVSKMMHRQGLSYTKPTYTLAPQTRKNSGIFAKRPFLI